MAECHAFFMIFYGRMSTEKFIYHLVPKQMTGDTLYPLNQLREMLPDVAAVYTPKYEGREEVMERIVPPLNCLWNDVLMFSAVHPQIIKQQFAEEGIKLGTMRSFQIPINRLDADCTAVYLFHQLRPYGNHQDDNTQFVMLSDIPFEPLTRTPHLLREHIRMARSEERRPFMFMGVPHILYKGTLSIADIEIIEC